MTRSRTAIDYSRRFGRVMAHMAEHLGQALELSALAEIANFSPFHFHRIYRSMTGATVAGTLRRLRLHRAAGDLVMGQRAVAAIARRAGYGSVAAFTRSFGAAYGVTPASTGGRGAWCRPTQAPATRKFPCGTFRFPTASAFASPPWRTGVPTWRSAPPRPTGPASRNTSTTHADCRRRSG